MKGTITNCLAELVETQFGKEKWSAILADAALSARATSFRMTVSDVPEDQVGRLLESTCKVLGINAAQAADAFGEYWCCTYAPRVYQQIVNRFKNARDMILGMDEVHVEMTKTIPNARPPRFNYKWENPNTLVVEYKSSRNWVDIYAGLVRGVGKHFKEKLSVTKIDSSHVKVLFS